MDLGENKIWTLNGLTYDLLYTRGLVTLFVSRDFPEQTQAIEAALKEDWTLQEKLKVLQSSIRHLDSSTVSPRTSVVLDVLNYARETETAVTHH
jgi:hypothetical protein